MKRNGLFSDFDRSLLLADFLSGFLILTIILFPETETVRVLLGTPFLLLFPGYAVVSALYPKNDFEATERLIYGMGLSLVFIPSLGILLNWSPYGLNLTSTIVSLFSIMILFTVISRWRRVRVAPEERFRAELSLASFLEWCSNERKTAVGCAIILILVVTGGSYLGTHQHGDQFTEFYLVEGENLEQGSNTVTIGIANHEGKAENYAVKVLLDGRELEKIESISLKPKESWQDSVSFQIEPGSENSTLKFLLYGSSGGPEKELRIHCGVN